MAICLCYFIIFNKNSQVIKVTIKPNPNQRPPDQSYKQQQLDNTLQERESSSQNQSLIKQEQQQKLSSKIDQFISNDQDSSDQILNMPNLQLDPKIVLPTHNDIKIPPVQTLQHQINSYTPHKNLYIKYTIQESEDYAKQNKQLLETKELYSKSYSVQSTPTIYQNKLWDRQKEIQQVIEKQIAQQRIENEALKAKAEQAQKSANLANPKSQINTGQPQKTPQNNPQAPTSLQPNISPPNPALSPSPPQPQFKDTTRHLLDLTTQEWIKQINQHKATKQQKLDPSLQIDFSGYNIRDELNKSITQVTTDTQASEHLLGRIQNAIRVLQGKPDNYLYMLAELIIQVCRNNLADKEVAIPFSENYCRFIFGVTEQFPEFIFIMHLEIISQRRVLISGRLTDNSIQNRRALADINPAGLVSEKDKEKFMIQMDCARGMSIILAKLYSHQMSPFGLRFLWHWFAQLLNIPLDKLDRESIVAITGILKVGGKRLQEAYGPQALKMFEQTEKIIAEIRTIFSPFRHYNGYITQLEDALNEIRNN